MLKYIDTMRTYDRLHDAGMPAEQARVHVQILSEIVLCLRAEQQELANTRIRTVEERAAMALRSAEERIDMWRDAALQKDASTVVVSHEGKRKHWTDNPMIPLYFLWGASAVLWICILIRWASRH